MNSYTDQAVFLLSRLSIARSEMRHHDQFICGECGNIAYTRLERCPVCNANDSYFSVAEIEQSDAGSMIVAGAAWACMILFGVIMLAVYVGQMP